AVITVMAGDILPVANRRRQGGAGGVADDRGWLAGHDVLRKMLRGYRVLVISRKPSGARSRESGNIVFQTCFVGRTIVGFGLGNSSFESAISGSKARYPMLYAILAYHVEAEVKSWTAEEDATVMTNMLDVHARLDKVGRFGPAARLGDTQNARTLRGKADSMVTDGPFAETKEQLLGFHVVNCETEEEAIETARELKRVNPTAVYEIRPIAFYLPGLSIPRT